MRQGPRTRAILPAQSAFQVLQFGVDVDSVEAFAAQARLFERWLLDATDTQGDAVREALVRLLALYGAGLQLPNEWSDALERASDVDRLSEDDWRLALEASRRLPFDLYSDIYNPTIVPPGQPVVGSISDDLTDIYRDVIGGLRAYEKGERAAAVWEWSFGLHSHWGAHATSAVRALHWWLVENAIDKMSTRPEGS
jgi:hypothetical protein